MRRSKDTPKTQIPKNKKSTDEKEISSVEGRGRGGPDEEHRVAAAVVRSSLTQSATRVTSLEQGRGCPGDSAPQGGNKHPQELLQGSRFLRRLSSSNHPTSTSEVQTASPEQDTRV